MQSLRALAYLVVTLFVVATVAPVSFTQAQTFTFPDFSQINFQNTVSSSISTSTFDVPLVSNEPVFSRVEIPGGFDGVGGDYPFRGIQWLENGLFVVSGPANSNAFVNNEPRAAGQVRESGGMYLLRESNGSFVASQNIVDDTSIKMASCFEGGGCSAGSGVLPIGNGIFVRDLQPDGSTGINRSPVLYQATSAGFSFIKNIFFNNGDRNVVPSGTSAGFLKEVDDLALANGLIVATTRRHISGNQSRSNNEIYDSNLNQITSMPALYHPIVGVGEYFIARGAANQNTFSSRESYVFSMPTAAEIAQGARPEKVQELSEGDLERAVIFGWALDPRNPNRVAISWFTGGSSYTVVVYEAGENGLDVVFELELGASGEVAHFPPTKQAFAVAGDFIAYGMCPRSAFSGGGEHDYTGCELVVENMATGERLNTAPLPEAEFPHEGEGIDGPGAQYVRAVGVSSGGRLLVATHGGRDNGNLYLYQISALGGPITGTPTPPPTSPVTPIGTPDTVSTQSINQFLSLAASYLRVVTGILGTGPVPTGPAPEPNQSDSVEDVYNEALRMLSN